MLARLFERARPKVPLSGVGANETTQASIYDWAKMFAPGAQLTYGGTAYQAYKIGQSTNSQLLNTNPIVFTCAAVRTLLFSEARFQWQQLKNGRPQDLFGNQELSILEEPWPGHHTRDLLATAEMDVAGAGQSYWVRQNDQLLRLTPEKMSIITRPVYDIELLGNQIGEQLVAYLFKPDNDPNHWTAFDPTQIFHYKPYPDPNNRFLGMSWLSPCLPDICVDDTVTRHKQSVLDNGASLGYVVSFDPSVNTDQFTKFVDRFHRQHEGADNANRTLFLGGGADVKTVEQTFENLALQATQGAGEVRIAAAAGVPPAILGVSEGLRGSTLNTGNYGQARRRLTDGTMRPLWGAFAAAIQSLLTVPPSSRLWYDDRDIAFCREDIADQATILQTRAAALVSLIHGGWKPDAAVIAVQTGDFDRLLGQHTGLTSVQLLPPGAGEPYPPITPPGTEVPNVPAPAPNGNGAPQPA